MKFFAFITYMRIAYVILAVGIMVRILQYIFHKDLWLDEAALAFSLYVPPFDSLFFQPLPHGQATPIGFLCASKWLGYFFDYNEYSLYFLPFVCGIGTMILSLYIGKRLFNEFGCCVFVLLCVGSLGLLHYSSEFKQYGIEAFCAFLMLYIYVVEKQKASRGGASLKNLALSCIVMMFFSNTIIFLYCGFVIGSIYNTSLAFIKRNAFIIVLPFLIFLIYYFLYIRFQATPYFYNYWANFFLPLQFSAYPAFFWDILCDVYSGFTPLGKKSIIPLYMLLGLGGIYALYRLRRDLFFSVVTILIIYILLSLLRIYPFGHGGIIGGRLSLYMSALFYLCITYALVYIYQTYSFSWLKMICFVGVISLTLITAVRDVKNFTKKSYHIQQTHALAESLVHKATPQDCIFVYKSAEPALMYYTRNNPLTYTIFKDTDIDYLALEMSKCQVSYIFASHYPAELPEQILAFAKNASIETSKSGWGAFLIKSEQEAKRSGDL